MSDAKSFIVLGLGYFGATLARRLAANGCRVTGVDRSAKNVEAVQSDLYAAVVGDVTDRETLEQLMLAEADGVFISLGERIEPSILAALHAKELDAKNVCVKGIDPVHGKILEKLGVDRVIFPKAEMALQLADRATWPNVLESLQLGEEYSLLEITVPGCLVDKTLEETDLRRAYGIIILGVRDSLSGKLLVAPHGDLRFCDDQILLALGKKADLDRFRELK